MARAPIIRITPEALKNHFEAPMKSSVQRRLVSPAPSAAGRLSSALPRSDNRMACVARTAVNRETMVPTPSVKAKPLTPAVASTKRMKATSRVTTLASTIVEKPLR